MPERSKPLRPGIKSISEIRLFTTLFVLLELLLILFAVLFCIFSDVIFYSRLLILFKITDANVVPSFSIYTS